MKLKTCIKIISLGICLIAGFYSTPSFAQLPPNEQPCVPSGDRTKHRAFAERVFPDAPRAYIVNWNCDTGYYMNYNAYPEVVKSIRIKLKPVKVRAINNPAVLEDLNIGAAAMDICLVILPPHSDVVSVQSGVEQICISQIKSRSKVTWPRGEMQIDFPGQGLFLPEGSLAFCSGQVATQVNIGSGPRHQYALEFNCEMDIRRADLNSPLAPVQTIRAPYIDERFFGNESAMTPHMNQTRHGRPIIGFFPYVATYGRNIDLCIDSKRVGGSWDQHCIKMPWSGDEFVSGTQVTPLNYSFAPGEGVSSHCRFHDPVDSGICAVYFFVAVPRDTQSFYPMAMNHTIPKGDAERYCYRDSTLGPNAIRSFTDPAIQDDRALCTRSLDVPAWDGNILSNRNNRNYVDSGIKSFTMSSAMTKLRSNLAFGGMYGFGYDSSHGVQRFVNPITGNMSCPAGYRASQIRGTTGMDWPAFLCFKVKAPHENAEYDFGGIFGDGTNSAGQQTTFKNPATNTHTCPAGYDRYILGYAVEGQKLVDNLLVYCMRRHVPGGPEFFGLYGFGYDYGSAATYRNPSTGQASCPNGTSAHTVYGAHNKDYPIVTCH